MQGACGRHELALEGPPASWKSMTDGEIAKQIANDQSVKIFLTAPIPTVQEVYVDRGSATGVVQIGAVRLQPGTKTAKVSLVGCTAPLQVLVDGQRVGELDLGARAYLITLEPNVCHVHQEVGYGDMRASKPVVYYPAKAVVALADVPTHVLESAPTMMKTYGGKGTVSSELVRTPCR
jgi:hypothetical protein